jgi:hypothetical protein
MDSRSMVALCLSSKIGGAFFRFELGNAQESPKISYFIWYTILQLFKKLFEEYAKHAEVVTRDDLGCISEITLYRYDGTEKEPNFKIRFPKVSLLDYKVVIKDIYIQVLTANADINQINNYCSDVNRIIKLVKSVKNIGEFDELVQVYNPNNL